MRSSFRGRAAEPAFRRQDGGTNTRPANDRKDKSRKRHVFRFLLFSFASRKPEQEFDCSFRRNDEPSLSLVPDPECRIRRTGSRIPNHQSRIPNGFTLIEILVVVVILAVLAGALTLAVGGVGGARQLAHAAAQAQALIGFACERAELTGREIGFSVNSKGYRFSNLDRGNWLPIGSDELRPRQWLPGMTLKLERDGHQVDVASAFPEKPQLVCFSSGELTAFQLQLQMAEVSGGYRIEGQPDGSVKLVQMDANAR
ncbi:MAG: type II secretion system minor pseudopilin GspH [Rudaea sp.]